jgi:uroporphyrinogen-III synthase
MSDMLRGRTVALAEGRQTDELAQILQKEGATPLPCPMVSIVDAPDARPVVDWLRVLAADRFSHVILMTGEGLRRLLGLAEREGLRDAAIAALSRTRTITRGPKPVRALQEVGIRPTKVAAVPTTAGVIASLQDEDVRGKLVGLQHYEHADPALVQALEAAGATVRSVIPYVYAPAADADRVAELIQRLSRGEVDAILFTSSPQVDRLYEVAGERGLLPSLAHGLKGTCVAAVGPVVADTLRQKGAPVHLCPEQGFVMKNLVQQLARVLER